MEIIYSTDIENYVNYKLYLNLKLGKVYKER